MELASAVAPPGRLAEAVSGQRLNPLIELGPRASVLLTTPAAQKLYRSAGAAARISNVLRLGEGARLEWLPLEARRALEDVGLADEVVEGEIVEEGGAS